MIQISFIHIYIFVNTDRFFLTELSIFINLVNPNLFKIGPRYQSQYRAGLENADKMCPRVEKFPDAGIS